MIDERAQRLCRLPDDIISSLRSSFSIPSLSSCVEELVHNAIDAQARTIDVILDLATWSCRVTDDGPGITPEDLSHVGKRYWTSKCHEVEDLERIPTFGFRGEALASLADAGMLEVISRHQDGHEMYKTLLRGGKRIYFGPARSKESRYRGTTVDVRDLFYKWPVRRKAMAANLTTQVNDARRTLEAIALVHPTISFNLSDASRTHLSSRLISVRAIDSSIVARWRSLWGDSLATKVHRVDVDTPHLRVDGFISLGASHSKRFQFLYVNNRLIAPGVSKHINARFARSSFATSSETAARLAHLSPSPNTKRIVRKEERSPRRASDLHPAYVLVLHVSPGDVDISLEPAKRVVAFRDEAAVVSVLTAIVDAFLSDYGFLHTRKRRAPAPLSPTRSEAFDGKRTRGIITTGQRASAISPDELHDEGKDDGDLPPDIPLCRSGSAGRSPPAQDHQGLFVDRTLSRREGTAGREDSARINENTHDRHKPRSPLAPRLHSAVASDGDKARPVAGDTLKLPTRQIAVSRADLANANFIAQVDRKFLLCRTDDTLLFIDQHAADERVRVERFLHSIIEADPIDTTAIDQHVLLSRPEAIALADRSDAFAKWGIAVETPPIIEADVDSVQARVLSVPSLVVGRCVDEPRLVSELIKQHLAHLEGESGSRSLPVGAHRPRHLGDCPRILLDLINTKACRGAIMFNDLLRDEQAERLVAQLAETDLPFHCAHGRPSLIAVAKLSQPDVHPAERLDWASLE